MPNPHTQVDDTAINQIYSRQSYFFVTSEITRTNNTTPYKIGDLINNSGASTLPSFDFTSIGSLSGRNITINTITLMSNNGGIIAISPIFGFYTSNTITGLTLADNTSFNPSYAQNSTKLTCTIEPLKTQVPIGNLTYIIIQNELTRIGQLDSSNKIYFALVANKAYIPIASEKFYITIKGYLD
jgi:hypothetical protein